MFRPEPDLPRKNLLSQRGASISCFSPGFKTSEDAFNEAEIPAEGRNRGLRGRLKSPRRSERVLGRFADASTNCGEGLGDDDDAACRGEGGDPDGDLERFRAGLTRVGSC